MNYWIQTAFYDFFIIQRETLDYAIEEPHFTKLVNLVYIWINAEVAECKQKLFFYLFFWLIFIIFFWGYILHENCHSEEKRTFFEWLFGVWLLIVLSFHQCRIYYLSQSRPLLLYDCLTFQMLQIDSLVLFYRWESL